MNDDDSLPQVIFRPPKGIHLTLGPRDTDVFGLFITHTATLSGANAESDGDLDGIAAIDILFQEGRTKPLQLLVHCEGPAVPSRLCLARVSEEARVDDKPRAESGMEDLQPPVESLAHSVTFDFENIELALEFCGQYLREPTSRIRHLKRRNSKETVHRLSINMETPPWSLNPQHLFEMTNRFRTNYQQRDPIVTIGFVAEWDSLDRRLDCLLPPGAILDCSLSVLVV